MIVATIIFGLLLLTYLLLYGRVGKNVVFILKMLTSIAFFVIGVGATLSISPLTSYLKYYSMFIILALACGVIGDCFLGIRNLAKQKKQKYFLLGIASFFLGHVFYLYALTYNYQNSFMLPIMPMLLIWFISIMSFDLAHVDFGRVRPVNYLYMLIASLLVAFSFVLLVTNFSIVTIFQFLGILLFVISDFVLAFIYFTKQKAKTFKLLKYLNIATYYLGQGLLAWTIFLIA